MRDEIFSKEFFKYTIENKKAKLCSYHGSKKNLAIPDILDGYSVTSIGWGAFLRCKSLVEIIIPSSITRIGGSAFYGCKNLTTVEIPNSVISIGNEAFGKCSHVTEIKLSEDHPVYSFFERTLFDKTTEKLLQYFGIKGSSSYIIPSFVTSITSRAFMQCLSLKSVEIPDSVTIIEHMAFYYCKNLATIKFGNSITTIERGAFFGCKKLKEVILPDSIKTIENYAFDERITIRGGDGNFIMQEVVQNSENL